jgi:Protein of unknown function, DUF481
MNWFIRLLFFVLAYPAFAQFNDSTSYYANYASAGVINKTNDGSSYVLNNALRFNISKKKVSFNTISSWVYGKQLNVLSNNDVSSAIDFNVYTASSKLYFWSLGTFDKSYSLKIDKRFQAGAGIGYLLINQKNIMINISDGILYEQGQLTVPEQPEPISYDTYRNSLRLKFRVSIKDRIVLDGNDFWQPSLSDKEDYILKSITNLNIKLQKWLSFTSSLTYNKFNISQRENLIWTFGLTMEKYF